jgi:hypothetical protein
VPRRSRCTPPRTVTSPVTVPCKMARELRHQHASPERFEASVCHSPFLTRSVVNRQVPSPRHIANARRQPAPCEATVRDIDGAW